MLGFVISNTVNPSRSKEFYNLVRPKKGGGVKLPPHENRYNFGGFKNFTTKLWGHLEKSITQVWVVKYFLKCHVTPMTSLMTSKASHFKGMVSNCGCSCASVMKFFCFLGFSGRKSHSNYCHLRDLHARP